jgi:3-oxoacyl-[acyl-carrier protein] reductase
MDVAIVTGASRGIGRATAIKLSKEYAVVVNYHHNTDKALEVVATIENMGGKAISVQGDVSNFEDAKRIVKEASKIGDLKILVNNAGVYDVKPLARTLPSEWERIFQVNVFGIFNMIKASLEYMQSGTIVNISSIIGIEPMSHAAPYCASKAAVIALTKSLAQELWPDIKVVCVAPGPTDTDMLRRVHGYIPADPPEKVANVVWKAIQRGKSGECIKV